MFPIGGFKIYMLLQSWKSLAMRNIKLKASIFRNRFNLFKLLRCQLTCLRCRFFVRRQ